MANNDAPFVGVWVGRPHSGKTTDMEEFCKTCGRETIFVYNAGWEKDWIGYEEIEIFADKRAEKLYFTYKGTDYPFVKNFMKKFRGKRVKKLGMLKCKVAQRLLYDWVTERKNKLQGLFFLIDDATTVMPASLTLFQKALFCNSKHAGVWFAAMFHGMDKVPNAAWDGITFVRMFQTYTPPRSSKAGIIPHYNTMVKAWEKLNDLPPYYSISIQMDTGKATIVAPN